MIRIKYAIESFVHGLLRIIRVFLPKNKNLVVFSSFSGRQYSDSPKNISQYLSAQYPEIDQIWAFNNPQEFQDIVNSRIKCVKFKSWEYIKAVLRCKVYVDNVEHWSALTFSKNQFLIQTWHGGGAYKRVGQDRLDIGELEQNHVIAKMNLYSVFLSSSTAFTDYVIKGAYHFNGSVMEVGLPRNDMLINSDSNLVDKVKQSLNIDSKSKILIYAPTFRKSLSQEIYNLDLEKVVNVLKEKFLGEWVVLVRLHYYMKDKLKKYDERISVLDVTEYPDMQELLLASDVLITDYSSSMWDFSLMYKPCFLYTPDLKQYLNERNFYTLIEDWPFAFGESNDALVEKIRTFDESQYVENVKKHHQDLGIKESGEATKQISELIVKIVRGE